MPGFMSDIDGVNQIFRKFAIKKRGFSDRIFRHGKSSENLQKETLVNGPKILR